MGTFRTRLTRPIGFTSLTKFLAAVLFGATLAATAASAQSPTAKIVRRPRSPSTTGTLRWCANTFRWS